jgi:hypothetical protein
MAVDYCNTCDSYVDLDWQDGYGLVNGEFMCSSCAEQYLPQWALEIMDNEGEVTYDPTDDGDGNPEPN